MSRRTIAGAGLLLVGLVGYVAGVYVAYPGRAFAVTAVMTGIVLYATGRRPATEAEV